MLGTRGIYHDGWKAATVTPATPDAWGDFANQRWELFNTQTDPSECHDLAEQRPDKLAELTALWWAEAGKYPPGRCHLAPIGVPDLVARPGTTLRAGTVTGGGFVLAIAPRCRRFMRCTPGPIGLF